MIKTYDDLVRAILKIDGEPYTVIKFRPQELAAGNGGKQEDKVLYTENLDFLMCIELVYEEAFYCNKCRDNRRMKMEFNNEKKLTNSCRSGFNVINSPRELKSSIDQINYVCIQTLSKRYDEILNGTIIKLTCLQCKSIMWLVIYKSYHGMDIMFLSEHSASVATKNTSEPVAYYLDQAYKAKSVGANSAAVTMYRAALEQLLYDKGYTDEVLKEKGFKKTMLHDKITALTKDIEDRVAEKWTKGLNDNILTIIKELGNGAIHTNGGDISKQTLLDDDIVGILDIMFGQVLYEAYEREAIEEQQLSQLSEVANRLKSR